MEWSLAEYAKDRTDLDLEDRQGNGRLYGYFRDIYNSPLYWVAFSAKGGDLDCSHMTLDEAKAVVEAMIRLEG